MACRMCWRPGANGGQNVRPWASMSDIAKLVAPLVATTSPCSPTLEATRSRFSKRSVHEERRAGETCTGPATMPTTSSSSCRAQSTSSSTTTATGREHPHHAARCGTFPRRAQPAERATRVYVSARVTRAGEVICVPADVLRHVITTNARLGDTILTAFMARRDGMLTGACVLDPIARIALSLRDACRARVPHAQPHPARVARSGSATSRSSNWSNGSTSHVATSRS